MENFLPFTDDVMVVLVHKCMQQTHLLALHLETLGYIPPLLNALNGLVYFLIIGDPRGDNQSKYVKLYNLCDLLVHIHQSQFSDSLLIHPIASILKVNSQCTIYMTL